MKIIDFYHFDSDPRFPPFLLYVRWKSGVTFVQRCFCDVYLSHCYMWSSRVIPIRLPFFELFQFRLFSFSYGLLMKIFQLITDSCTVHISKLFYFLDF